MPNWCSNRLSVFGSTKKLQEFVSMGRPMDTADKSELKLHSLFPMPKDLEDTKSPVDRPNPTFIRKYGFDNWYDWKVANWGVKWDIDAQMEDMRDVSNPHVTYVFDTAWGPPDKWLKEIAHRWPALKFELEFIELCMNFCGQLIYENGEVLVDESRDANKEDYYNWGFDMEEEEAA